MERVVASRITEHMTSVGPDVSYSQFGFRPGRSTVGAIRRLRSRVDRAVARGRVVLAISLDIANAFNSLPWSKIREGLARKRIPPYLEAAVGAYLGDRVVTCRDRDGDTMRRVVSRGVPQGSVLGPLLWNIGYDRALDHNLPAGVSLVCYADDTLVVVSGDTWGEARRAAADGLALVLTRIRRLGLKVALSKTEVIWFGGPREKGPRFGSILVEGTRVEVKSQMKYLGLTLDSKWGFVPHFEKLAVRLGAAAPSLSRLMPNLGGPCERVRCLYAGVVALNRDVWRTDMVRGPCGLGAAPDTLASGAEKDGHQGRASVPHYRVRGGMHPGGLASVDVRGAFPREHVQLEGGAGPRGRARHDGRGGGQEGRGEGGGASALARAPPSCEGRPKGR
jgi:hypothetical protein